MPIVTVAEKGQFVIPAAVRALLGIRAGTRIEISIESGGFRAFVEPDRKTRTAASCLGVADYKGPKIDLSNIDVAPFAEKTSLL
jgi:AbrB family looped-hinge helix DNA binding protein